MSDPIARIKELKAQGVPIDEAKRIVHAELSEEEQVYVEHLWDELWSTVTLAWVVVAEHIRGQRVFGSFPDMESAFTWVADHRRDLADYIGFVPRPLLPPERLE